LHPEKDKGFFNGKKGVQKTLHGNKFWIGKEKGDKWEKPGTYMFYAGKGRELYPELVTWNLA